MILIDAPPLPGMTRWVLECVRDARPDVEVIHASPAGLVAAAYAGSFDALSPYQPYVVWLDDLSPAGLVLLEPDVLATITVQAAVVANVTTTWCARIENDTAPITAGARAVLDTYAQRITLPEDLSADERRRAHTLFPELKLTTDVAESMVGGDRLLYRYDRAGVDHPAGWVLVAAAVDTRRAGVYRGLSKTELLGLYERAAPPDLRTREHFDAAFEWATAVPPGCTVGLLAGEAERGWCALSYLAGADDGEHMHFVRPLPPWRWATLLEQLRPDDAFDVAVAAHLRGEPGIAKRAFERAAACRDVVLAGQALGALNHPP